MNLDTLVLPEEDAAERLKEYEAAIRLDRNEEDVAIAAGYRAAKRGLPVIMLSNVMAAGGFHDNGLPKLAVARADATQCWCRVEGWGGGPDATRSLVFTDQQRTENRGAIVARHSVRVRDVPFNVPDGRHRSSGKTIVPSIPPRFRPRPGRIRGFHILWEVDEWTPAPPVDPALLRHIRGDLWSVQATWDLTPLERAVLTARARTVT